MGQDFSQAIVFYCFAIVGIFHEANPLSSFVQLDQTLHSIYSHPAKTSHIPAVFGHIVQPPQSPAILPNIAQTFSIPTVGHTYETSSLGHSHLLPNILVHPQQIHHGIPRIVSHPVQQLLLNVHQCLKPNETESQTRSFKDPLESCNSTTLDLIQLYTPPKEYPPTLHLEYKCPQVPQISLNLELCTSADPNDKKANCTTKVLKLNLTELIQRSEQRLNVITQKIPQFRFDYNCPKACELDNDIFIMLDSSFSINPDDFEKAKGFVADLSLAFTGNDANRLYLVDYADGNRPIVPFGYHPNSERVDDIIRLHSQFKGLTEAGAAIRHVVDTFKNNSRDVPRSLIIITDGISSDSVTEPVQEALKLNFNIVAVGVGSRVTTESLLQLTGGDMDNIIELKEYSELDQYLGKIGAELCAGGNFTLPDTKNMKQQQEIRSGADTYFCDEKLDVGILLDSSDYNVFDDIKSFGYSLGKKFVGNRNLRLFISDLAYFPKNILKLGSYDRRSDIVSNISLSVSRDKDDRYIGRALHNVGQSLKQARIAGAKQVVLLVLTNVLSIDGIEDAISQLNENNVEIFVVGIRNDSGFNNWKELTGNKSQNLIEIKSSRKLGKVVEKVSQILCPYKRF